MTDLIEKARTTLTPEEVIVRAVQFFTNENWRPQSQSGRIATFQGKPPIPWGLLFLTFIGFLFFVIPGIIMYVMVVRRVYRFHNLVVTANPIDSGSEVVVSHPKYARKLVSRFANALPTNAESTA